MRISYSLFCQIMYETQNINISHSAQFRLSQLCALNILHILNLQLAQRLAFVIKTNCNETHRRIRNEFVQSVAARSHHSVDYPEGSQLSLLLTESPMHKPDKSVTALSLAPFPASMGENHCKINISFSRK